MCQRRKETLVFDISYSWLFFLHLTPFCRSCYTERIRLTLAAIIIPFHSEIHHHFIAAWKGAFLL